MSKKIPIKITYKDVKNSGAFTNNTNCPLAKVLKRIFPYSNIFVRTFEVEINGVKYSFKEKYFDSAAYDAISKGKPFVSVLTKTKSYLS